MRPSKAIKSRKVLAFMAVVLGAMLTTMLLPAYAQQEIDPTWYDPYAAHDAVAKVAATTTPAAVAVHAPQPAMTFHRHESALKTASSVRRAAKLQEKQPAAQPRIAEAPLPAEPNEDQRSARGGAR
jgi:hypothetical protein